MRRDELFAILVAARQGLPFETGILVDDATLTGRRESPPAPGDDQRDDDGAAPMTRALPPTNAHSAPIEPEEG